MKQVNDIPSEVRSIIPFVKFLTEHPMLANILLAVEIAAFIWAVISYEFTTTI